ncbi:DUF6528 family protein [Luteolibacter sp. Populi]|uniref:DUF6528 family protein n=1 Tax=Luteolibacter sp. Populi TaxID=3230487 RepID=UPI003467B89D
MILRLLVPLLLVSTVLSAERVVVCGGAEVYQIDPAAEQAAKLWSWRAKDCEGLPEGMKGAFATTDDCKPLEGGKKLLVSASSGGCVLLEMPAGKALWWARVKNAHSIEGLPGGLIAVAASTGKEGNKVLLFDSAVPEKVVAEIPLHSAHGLVWDEPRKILWALGFEELLACELKAEESPALEVKARYPLPDKDGHDLRAVPGAADLVLSTHGHVWRFDREKKEFRKDPELGDRKLVKCVEPNAAGRLLVIKASEEHWWAEEIGFLNPAGKVSLKGEMVYKARWWVGE